jgi:Fe-S oxidoreductase
VAVLEEAGYRVDVPPQRLCCGRPLYSYGMLDLAKRKLREAMAALRPAIRAGVPIVGLEPSCVSVFRDELRNLFPHDVDASRLASQVKTLSELLIATKDWRAPPLRRRALAHLHCHARAVLSPDSDIKLFELMGLDLVKNPAGCCGVAGAFGYETEHYEVAMKIGEHDLLPLARRQDRETLIISDGFSCRYQMMHGAQRWPLHPAEVIQMAQKRSGAADRLDIPDAPAQGAKPGWRDAWTLGLLATAGAAIWVGARLARR